MMENEELFQIEPNRIAEYYRTRQLISSSTKMEKNWDFINIFKDGATLLGSSDMNGRRWDGCVFYFSSPDDTPQQDKAVCKVCIDSGATDGKFLHSENLFAVGDDSGTLSIYGLTKMLSEKSARHIIRQSALTEHDDGITSLDVFPDRVRVLTGSYDSCIKIWDCDAMVSEVTYRPAHSHSVTYVSIHHSGEMFASASLDHTALIWDFRQDKPAQLAFECNVGVTAVTWQPGESFVLAVGTQSGDVSLVDTRNTKQVLANTAPSRRPIFKISFSPVRHNLMAVCADNEKVCVLDCNSRSLTTMYEDTRHQDFVRGLSWSSSDILYSCSWDHQILTHKIEKTSTPQKDAGKAT